MARLQRNSRARRQPGVGGVFAEPPLAIVLTFLGFVVFWYLQGGYRIPALGQIRFELLVGSLLCLYACFSNLNRHRRADSGLGDAEVVRWSVALLALMVVWVILSVSPEFSFDVFVDRALKMAMIGFMIASFVTSPRLLAWFIGTYLLAFGKMTQEGVLGYVTGAMVWENQGIPRLHATTPMYAHPNSLAGTQLGTIPFLIGLLPLAPKWLRILLIGQAVAVLGIVVVCGSRTAYVAFLGWLAFRVASSKHRMKTLVVGAILLTVIASILPLEYHERFNSIFTGHEAEGSSTEARLEILRDAWQVFLTHPFGVGVGAFPIVRMQMFGRTQDTHNLYLEVATNLGVPGIIVFAAFLLSIFRALRRIRDRTGELLLRLQHAEGASTHDSSEVAKVRNGLNLVRVVCVALTSFLVIRLYLGFFGMDLYEVYWWFSAGLTVAMARIVSSAEPIVDEYSGATRARHSNETRRVPRGPRRTSAARRLRSP